MGFESLRFFQFRNIVDQTVSLRSAHAVAREIFLIGQNGQGKTNFLEGVYLLAYGSSFRTKIDRRLCRHGEQEFSLMAETHAQGSPSSIQVKLEAGKKQIVVDGTPVTDRRELLRRMPCIAFTHEDFEFVSGSPEFQRLFFDQSLSLFDVVYVETLRRYRKMLRARNVLLLQGEDPRVLEVYEHQLAEAGRDLMTSRGEVVELFNPQFARLFGQITGLGGACTLRYQPSWKDPDQTVVTRLLAERRDSDRKLGFTSTGPHRDRYGFIHGGRNFAEHASTGQIRLLSLLLRVVQARLALERTGQPPVLLLDDVLLELDAGKRQQVLDLLPDYDQAFFTVLPDQQVGPREPHNPLYLRVEAGQYTAQEVDHG